jgi:hypothetical protein
MEEHNDDLEPTVHEGAEQETQGFPTTEEEFDDTLAAEGPIELGDEEEDEDDLDPDKSEL